MNELSREEFDEIQTKDEVKRVLDDLEVHEIDRVNLFDVLDAPRRSSKALFDLSEGPWALFLTSWTLLRRQVGSQGAQAGPQGLPWSLFTHPQSSYLLIFLSKY